MTAQRLWLAGLALAGVAAVAAAYVSQHHFDMQPCPWCVLQRLIFLCISAFAVLALLLPGLLRKLTLVPVLLLALGGAAAALWQHFVAASAESCNLTLADRLMAATGLDALWPELFMATASCADAKVNLFGLPYEAWSLGLFVLMAGVAARLLLAPRR